jgi:hypothetical protein
VVQEKLSMLQSRRPSYAKRDGKTVCREARKLFECMVQEKMNRKRRSLDDQRVKGFGSRLKLRMAQREVGYRFYGLQQTAAHDLHQYGERE